jgi:hypothetical protein
MFCANCGSKIEKSSKFCHHCGVGVSANLLTLKKESKIKQISKPSLNTDNLRETLEEYQAKTNIKNKKEAKKYLNQLKALFWIVFLSMIIIHSLSELKSELATILFIPYILLLIYFIYFCTKILKAERLPKSNAALCIIFAPLSWAWLYPLMANPLKIILEEKQPPIRLNEAEKKQKAAKANKKFWRNFWIITEIIIGIFTISLIAIFLLT